MALGAMQRHLLDIQGFGDVDDVTLGRTQLWLRLSPALCGVIAAAGVIFASPPVLFGLAVIAAAGAILPFHPFDLAYNLVLRRWTRGPRLPSNGAPRRFACGLASAWLVITGGLFAVGYDVPAYALGAAFVAVAALVATTHICIPSIMFRTACGQMPSLRPAKL